jgi:hypothetical protein
MMMIKGGLRKSGERAAICGGSLSTLLA